MDKLPSIQDLILPPKVAPTLFYGVFAGMIDQNSFQKFSNTLAHITQQNKHDPHLHLLLQSTGGTIGDGIAMYNLIKNSPINVTLYNQGSVSSMATLVFLAAKQRVASKHATFMLHSARCAPQAYLATQLTDVLRSLKIDDARTNAILRSHINLTDEQWAHIRNNELWLTADDALKSGFITDIGDFAPPRGMQLLTFNF